MKHETISYIYSLLGKAVLNPVPSKKKECFRKGWQRTTWEESQAPEYQKALQKHGNTGVLLGKLSDDLTSVDCDSDPFLAEFLAVNPTFNASLISKGKRGGNVWLRMTGDYPSTYKLVKDGQPWGEFRSNGSQTMIAGIHPAGDEYRLHNDAPPLVTSHESIKWPEGVIRERDDAGRGGGERDSSISLHSSLSSPTSHTSPTSLLYDTPSPEAIAVLERFQKEQCHLHRLYERLIAHFLPLVVGSRNLTLTNEIVPRLFGAMSFQAAAEILKILISANRLGGYSPQEARSKFESAWRGVEASWPDKLSPVERSTQDALQDAHCRELFKICRELALNDSNDKFPPPTFYIPCGCLAVRLALRQPNGKPDSKTAGRLLRKFWRDYRILRLIDPGKAHGHKEQGRAAVFAWNFPLLPQPNQTKP